ncbi:apoptosis regulator Bcl-2-like [Leuresthes tenuis]|uniref:apoptosis regulator Bcl-2-like n=1 Tax=Leuresthes tenuis TaxID=355514 RepID=UPI003B504778
MAAPYSSRDIVEDFLRHRLLSRGVAWRFPLTRRASRQRRRGSASSPSDVTLHSLQSAPPRLQAALRGASDELEQRLHRDLSAQLLQRWGSGGAEALRRSLAAIRDELFRDGVNWGRIVAMMLLGGALSSEVAQAGERGPLDDVIDWMEESLNSPPIRRWIQDNGGWDAFVELYESRPPVSFWSLRTVFGLVVLGAAGITLGALFTQR